LQRVRRADNRFVEAEKRFGRAIGATQHALEHQVLDDTEFPLCEQRHHLAEFIGRQIGQKAESPKIHSQDWPLMPTELMASSQDRSIAAQDKNEVGIDGVERLRFGFDIGRDLDSGLRAQELHEFLPSALHSLDVAASQHDQFQGGIAHGFRISRDFAKR
ncbi:MAG: hypothetical protein FD138_4389, partial [Planctomycetota bacterium]